MTETMPCPCNSGKLFVGCCKPIITGIKNAKTAEALMRSRYTGYVKHEVEYLLKTWHPSTRPSEINPASIPQWCNLQVVNTKHGEESDHKGIVEFKATFISRTKTQILHEISYFIKEEGFWYYLDGNIQTNSGTAMGNKNVGRNSPCPCGSGKKFKKCCSP